MKEVEANKASWGMLSQGHYEYYKKAIQENRHGFSKIIEEELGVKNIDFKVKKIKQEEL